MALAFSNGSISFHSKPTLHSTRPASATQPSVVVRSLATGDDTLSSNSTGTGNIALGSGASFGVTTSSNVICIGLVGANVTNTTWIGHIYNTTTVSGTTLPVVVSDGGQLGTTPSSRRFKKGIKPMDKASETILALRRVTFRYKSDTTDTP